MLYVKNHLEYDNERGIKVIADESVELGRIVARLDQSFDKVLSVEEIESLPEAIKDHFYRYCYEYEFGKQDKFVLAMDNERFMNHSNTPNVDQQGFACRKIKIGDEITSDYKLLDSACTTGAKRSEPWLES